MDKTRENNKRFEIKFLLSKKNENFLSRNFKIKKLFPDRVVYSMYFDTASFKFFRLSEEGLTPRIKIRLRGYNKEDYNNLEIKKTNSYEREKIVFKNFNYNFINFNTKLKQLGISTNLLKKLKVKYLRSYFFNDQLGRITFDKNISFSLPESINYYPIKEEVMEVKVNSDDFDKSDIERLVNLKESRFSKYCMGINYLYNS